MHSMHYKFGTIIVVVAIYYYCCGRNLSSAWIFRMVFVGSSIILS